MDGSDDPARPTADDEVPVEYVELYWRRGCGFCSRLIRGLEATGLPVRMHDIWADPEAAATVRAAARGNETVPTVGVAGEYLVNPSLDDVVELVGRRAPHLTERPAG